MKIGIFDSGYGGLTILEKIRARLPQYDYVYFGDNARINRRKLRLNHPKEKQFRLF